MKYLVIEEGIPPELVTATMLGTFGDPSLWVDEVHLLVSDGIVPEWATVGAVMNTDYPDLDSSWTVLGPSVEDKVAYARGRGARYLALDDGLIELDIEEEEEVPVVPDVPEQTPEVPATPKRTRRPRKPKVEQPTAPAEPEWTDEQRAALTEAYDTGYRDALTETSLEHVKDETTVSGHLRAIIAKYVHEADEADLWEMAYQLRNPSQS